MDAVQSHEAAFELHQQYRFYLLEKGKYECIKHAMEYGEVSVVNLRERLEALGILKTEDSSQTWLGSVFGILARQGVLKASGRIVTYTVPKRNNHKKTAPVWILSYGVLLPKDPGIPYIE